MLRGFILPALTVNNRLTPCFTCGDAPFLLLGATRQLLFPAIAANIGSTAPGAEYNFQYHSQPFTASARAALLPTT